jgi:hypothetical protein
MSAHSFADLADHAGHQLECVIYGDNENAAIECVDCSTVLLDFDRDELHRAVALEPDVEVQPGDIVLVLDTMAELLGKGNYAAGEGPYLVEELDSKDGRATCSFSDRPGWAYCDEVKVVGHHPDHDRQRS